MPHLDFGMSLWYAWYAILRLQIYDELEVGQLNKAPSTEIRTFLGSHSIFFFLPFSCTKKMILFLCTSFIKQFMTASSNYEIVAISMEIPKPKSNLIQSNNDRLPIFFTHFWNRGTYKTLQHVISLQQYKFRVC